MAPVFCKAEKKIILIKRRVKSLKQKLLEMVQVTVLFHTDEFHFCLVFQKREWAPKPTLAAETGLLRQVGAKTWFSGDTRNLGGRRGLSYTLVAFLRKLQKV